MPQVPHKSRHAILFDFPVFTRALEDFADSLDFRVRRRIFWARMPRGGGEADFADARMGNDMAGDPPGGPSNAGGLAASVPELAPPFSRGAPVRIPELRNVALTRRVLGLIDHPDFQRLRRVKQLGPTHLVYPGAVHTRFEHSIGVFENARSYILALLKDREFAPAAEEGSLLAGLAAALLHDVGHYPFAHSLEALHHKGLAAPKHEDLAADILTGKGAGGIGLLLEKEWRIDPGRVAAIISKPPQAQDNPADAMLSSMLHSPIDADKMDYLDRDSIHMGVPYGRNYDRDRLLASLRISPRNRTLAVTDKGKISAEIFIFCRYTMFSEAYWHHTVRSASAMAERALEDFRTRAMPDGKDLARLLLSSSDEDLLAEIARRSPASSSAGRILAHFTSGRRSLFKRVLSLSLVHTEAEYRAAYEKVYALDRGGVHKLEDAVREVVSMLAGFRLHAADVIVDTPPPGKDRVEEVDVLFGDGGDFSPLSGISKIVEGVGADFVKVVKKIRVFVEPEAAAAAISAHGKRGVAEKVLRAILA